MPLHVWHRLTGAEYNLIHMSKEQIEVSFKNKFNPSSINLPLSVDIRLLSVHILEKSVRFRII